MTNDFGVAKDSKLYVTDVMKSIFFYVSSFNSYLTTAYGRRARVSSNSWGCANPYDCTYDCTCYEFGTTTLVNDSSCMQQYGLKCCQVCNQYDSNSAVVDSFTRDNDEMLIVIAAGNNGYYSADSTVLAPASAKNSLAVGAQYASTSEYTRYDPIANTTLFNNENVPYFSSRGPTFDSRTKPDVVAPGVSIYAAQKGATSCSSQEGLVTKSGTSMAAPAVAGSAALVRDYFLQSNGSRLSQYDLFNKDSSQTLSGTLVKAVIIHSAQKMKGTVSLDSPGSSLTVSLENQPFPNIYNGFGSVNLKNVLLFENNTESVGLIGKLHTINRFTLIPGQEIVIPFNYTSKKLAVPFKATLVWYDYKGTVTTSETSTLKQLINDVDMRVDCGNRRYYGNPGVTNNQGYDSVNTVESLLIDPNDPCLYFNKYVNLTIIAKSNNIGNQTFSLVVTGQVQVGTANILDGYIIISKGTILSQNSVSLNVPGSIASDRDFGVQRLIASDELNIANEKAQYIIDAASDFFQELNQKICTVSNMDQNIPSSGLYLTPGVYCFPQGLGGSGKVNL